MELPDEPVWSSVERHSIYMLETASYVRKLKKSIIHKVPGNLRQVCPDAYEPKLVSIGPLHHHTHKLKQMDHLKWKYLKELMERILEDKKLEKSDDTETWHMVEFLRAMWELLEDVLQQYSVEIAMEAGELVQVLALDGCFLIELFIKRAMGSPRGDAKWYLPMLRRDLLLLENQIPFSVLEALFKIAFPQGIIRPTHADKETPPHFGIFDLAVDYISEGKMNTNDLGKQPDEIHHLLHLNHICLLRYFNSGPAQNSFSGIRGSLVNYFFFFVSLILMCKLPRYRSSEMENFPRGMRSAKNLMEGGISFTRKHTGNYLNVSFNEESGDLEIPFLYLHSSSVCDLCNLVVFELCCPDVEAHFLAYANFMNNIIGTAEDVEILVRHGIIEHKLGSNKDVANLFNNLCKEPILLNNKNYLSDLEKRVSKYCTLDRHRWRAALVNYFDKPGTSIIAAAFLMLLTLGATIATIWQTVYTVQSYQKQF